MSTFSAEWLALRESFDVTARSDRLATSLRAAWADLPTRRILDLATGTGANLRYLAPRLGGDQQWLLVDRDLSLLAALPQGIARWAMAEGYGFATDDENFAVRGTGFSARIRCLQLDLAADFHRLPLAGVDLVTASALLDLVSGDWLGRLADACRGAGSAALFALTYDGRVQWVPPDGDDGLLRALLNRHQHTDKGFGPALGPRAAATARSLFTALGFRTEEETTDWRFGTGDQTIQSRLIDDWSTAAMETAPSDAPRIADWRQRRLRHVARAASCLTVGHADLLALPRGISSP